MIDAFGRTIDYLRISVTDRCNLRCVYCMPAEGVPLITHDDVLSYEAISDFVGVAVSEGIRKVRLTGGEPLVRRGVVSLVERLARIEGIEDLCMTTNGTLLGTFAEPLAKAGLGRVNVSLDSLDPERYRAITRGGDVRTVLAGIEAGDRGRVDAGEVELRRRDIKRRAGCPYGCRVRPGTRAGCAVYPAHEHRRRRVLGGGGRCRRTL